VRRKLLVAAALVLLVLAAAGGAVLWIASRGTPVDVPEPAPAGAYRALPEPERSVVHLPVTLALDSLIGKVERAVPRGDNDEDEWKPLGEFPVVGTLYVKQMWERDPLQLTLGGERLEVGAHVRYRARIAERACVPVAGCRWVTLASCGHDGPMPTLDVGLRTDVAWKPDWTVVPQTRARPVRAGVRCRLTRANVDVTERVAELVQKELGKVAPQVDAELREEVDLRRRVEDVWGEIQKPIKAADGVYLLLRPESVAVAPPRADGTRIGTEVAVTVRPKVVIGDRPAVDSVPLPAYGPYSPGRGFRIAMTAELTFVHASELLREALVGKSHEVRGRTVRVRDVRLYAGGGDRVVMAVRVGGDARGTLYFVGTPRYDAAAQVVSVPDLDFSVETKNVLGGAASWLLYERLREQMRAAARFGVGERIAELRQDVNEAINRNLSSAVRLSGRIDTIHPVGVVVTPQAVAAVVESEGRARIDITIR
jgi:hypothetical protein